MELHTKRHSQDPPRPLHISKMESFATIVNGFLRECETLRTLLTAKIQATEL